MTLSDRSAILKRKREKRCGNKHPHASEQLALVAAQETMKQHAHNRKYGNRGVKAYLCKQCGSWHWGHC